MTLPFKLVEKKWDEKCSSGEMGQQMKLLEVITYLLINGIWNETQKLQGD